MMSRPSNWSVLLLGALMALLAGLVLHVGRGEPQTTPSSGMRVRSSGTDLGRATIVNCTTGVTCTLSGSIWTLSASGGGSTPTGTGFIHVTAGVQDAAAKLVDTADITNNAVTLGKLATQANLTILANISGGAAVPTASTFTAILDAILGTTQGSVLYRDGSTWTTLPPGTNGQFLQTQGAAANIQWATLAGGGNVSASGTPTNGQIAQWTNATTIQGITLVPVANGGTNLASGTSGGVLAYTASGTLASSAALGANLPVIGGGAGVVPSTGTRSGNTTAFVTTTGSQTSGDCVKIDANGNHIANGSACGGSGGITVYSRDATAFSYNTDATKRTVYSFSVGAGDLGTTKALRVRIQGNLLMNSGSCTFTPEIKLGGTVLWADATGAIGNSTVRRSFIIEFIIANQNATNVQVMNGTIWIGNIGAATTGFGDLGTVAIFAAVPFSGSAAEDTTGALTLTVSTTLSVSNAADEVVANYRIAELL